MPTLPLGRQIGYAVGQLGWPRYGAGIPPFITKVTFLGVLNALPLNAASGRLLDAITEEAA